MYVVSLHFIVSVPDCRLCKVSIHNRTCISCDMINCSVSCVCTDKNGNLTRSIIKLKTDVGRRCNPWNNGSDFQCYDYSHVKVICPDTSMVSQYAESIKLSDIMEHLNELHRIASIEGGTRAVKTKGFNRTLDYITDYLSANTNYKVTKSFFPLRDSQLATRSTLSALINGIAKEYIYSTSGDFYHIEYSALVNFANYVPLTVIPNLGCLDSDWLAANPSSVGRVALVKRGLCTFDEKVLLAVKYNVTGLLIYNDGTASDRIQPIVITLSRSTKIPALFLSYTLGQALVNATKVPLTNVSVRINIFLVNDAIASVGNICADTPTGDSTQTIVIGSHSDSVMAGSGINDNG